jgi:diguanylate cyclase (GGDEF)-like protein/PAS domain S-box-containing protein
MDSSPNPETSQSSAESTPPASQTVELDQVPAAPGTPVAAAQRHEETPGKREASVSSPYPVPVSPSSAVESTYQNQLVQVRLGMATSLFAALRAKHAQTAAHSLRVALGCSSWGLRLDLDEHQRDELEVAALLHDIGKIGVPDRILLKPDRLNREEAATIERHRQTGQQILSGCCVSKEMLAIVQYTHAWWDGSRSGFSLQQNDIPLGSRVIAIVDAYDAMITDQVYRRAMSRERAIAELFACAGTQFDPELVEHFCDLLTSDHVTLTSQISRRWLDELTPDRSNEFWTWNSIAGGASSAPNTVDALFQQKLMDSMLDGVVFVDTNMQIVLWNRAAERLTGLSASSVLSQRWSSKLMGLRDEEGVPLTEETCPVVRSLKTRVQTLRRLTMFGRGGERLSIDARIVPVIGRDRIMQGATMLLHDASSQITMEQRIESLHHKATRDPLTNVANRAEFDRAHAELVTTHLTRGLPCALMICDIDHFKAVNDTYGHQAGDEVLISFAALLQRASGTGDLVARYGGEEFVMLCADCDNATITQRAEKIRRDLEETPQSCLDNRPITASFGVTEIQAGDTPETMLRRADRALLRAKESGRNRVVQLGTGIPEDIKNDRRNVFRRWLQPTPSSHLLQETLVTAVPLAVTMEKLRGFISDHHAEIASTEDGKLRLQITKSSPGDRRSSDRPVNFVLSLQFLEQQTQGSGRTAGTTRTVIRVSIQLANYRDRRLDNAYERARQLFASLKSYFMAQAFDGPVDPYGPEQNPTILRRLLSLLHLNS